MKFSQIIAASIAVSFSFSAAVSALAADFPLSLTHKFGTTIIEKKPINVVSLSYVGHDNLLAYGVKPVAVRAWYGDYPYSVWPWAQAALGDHQPEVLTGELDIEKIASLQPDLILGLSSGITEAQYMLLSAIAPTVAPEAQYTDYSTPWQVMAITQGKAVGELEQAQSLVAAVETQIANIVKKHPDWQGKTASVTFYYDGNAGGYTSIDKRSQLLKNLGLETPKAIDDVAEKDSFYVTLSPEDLSPLDADVVLWLLAGNQFKQVKDLALRKTMRAHKQGREIVVNDLLSGAFSFSSVLSLPYALDELVPMIEVAIDGDPSTVVPSSKQAGLLD